jgi:hypothetical protein
MSSTHTTCNEAPREGSHPHTMGRNALQAMLARLPSVNPRRPTCSQLYHRHALCSKNLPLYLCCNSLKFSTNVLLCLVYILGYDRTITNTKALTDKLLSSHRTLTTQYQFPACQTRQNRTKPDKTGQPLKMRGPTHAKPDKTRQPLKIPDPGMKNPTKPDNVFDPAGPTPSQLSTFP